MHLQVEKWNQQYFDNHLSETCQMRLATMDFSNKQLVDFVNIVFHFMKLANFNAKNFYPDLATWFATYISSYLPRADQTHINLTGEGRLASIDEYFHKHPDYDQEKKLQYLDVGCGIPPYTTIETAKMFTNWEIEGIDPEFPYYVLFDKDGHAGCYDSRKKLIYTHFVYSKINTCTPAQRNYIANRIATTWKTVKGSIKKLLPGEYFVNKGRIIKPEGAQKKPLAFLKTISDKMSAREDINFSEHEFRLINDPLIHNQRSNLTFKRCDFEGFHGTQKYDIIRCFNVLLGENAVIHQAIDKAAQLLKPGGIFIYGAATEIGLAVSYVTYKKQGEKLTPDEFSFTVDHLRPIMLAVFWSYSIARYDRFLLSKLIALFANDKRFMQAFSKRYDALLDKSGLAERDANDYLYVSRDFFLPDKLKVWIGICDKLLKEFSDDIIKVLTNNKLQARMNHLGHITVALSSLPAELQEGLYRP